MPGIETLPSTAHHEDRLATCRELIHRSNELYRQMLQVLKVLSKSPEAASPSQLLSQREQFNELQSTIEASDRLLNTELLELKGQTEQIQDLLHERHGLIEQLLQCNRTVMIQAQAVKTLIGDEIRKSSIGYAAMKGYRTADHQRSGTTFRKAM